MGEGKKLVFVFGFVVGVIGRGFENFEFGSDDIVEQFLEDFIFVQIFDEFGIVLFKFLDQIVFIEKFFKSEIGFVEDGVDGGDVGVVVKFLEYGCVFM